MIIILLPPFLFEKEEIYMMKMDEEYNAGGTFETTIGNTQYEVVINFKQEGMSMQEKALRAVKERISSTSEEV